MFADDFQAPSFPVFQRRIYANGFCVVPLFGVLEILKLKVQYREDAFIYHCTETGKERFRSPRNLDYRTPWEMLWEKGLLGTKEFTKRAREWFRENPYVPYDQD